MFPKAIKKMALNQLFGWMQKENISELKVWKGENGEIQFTPAHHPHRFIHTQEIDAKLEEYRQEFARLRREVSLRDEQILTLQKQIKP